MKPEGQRVGPKNQSKSKVPNPKMNIFSILKKYNIHPKRRLGQNFMVAYPTIEKIVNLLEISPFDKVFEIGPGIGVMTKLLTERARFVAAIESDREMADLLENELGGTPNLHIIHGDVLDANLEKLLGRSEKWLFIGNIPYNITSPILFHIRDYRRCFRRGVLTVQKEVAEKIVAQPGCKNYGILSILMQATSKIERCFNISPSSFLPKPSVDSSAIKIEFYEDDPYGVGDFDHFAKTVRAAFSARRKKLKNSLAQSHFLNSAQDDIETAIRSAGLTGEERAEELSIETFVLLAKVLQ